MTEVSNAQRALWTFLLYTLVGPFFGALAVAVVMIIAGPLGLSKLLPPGLPPLGAAVLHTFVWGAIPAALAALGLVVFVLRNGTFGWTAAAIAGVVAFWATAQVIPISTPDLVPVLAFGAGLVSVALREVLMQARILRG